MPEYSTIRGAGPRPDPDHRPSIRTLLAAKLVRGGHDPAQVSELTGVPVALVQLIRGEIDTTGHGTN